MFNKNINTQSKKSLLIEKLKPNKLSKKNIYVMAIFLGILMLSSIGLTITSATKGAEISYLEKQKMVAREEMEELSSKVVSSTSLSQVAQAAPELGLIKPDNIVYLNGEVASVASLR